MLGDKTNSRGYQMSYEHLSLEERHYIEISMKSGQSLKQIANHLDRAQSTISREVKRNHGLRGYRHQQANKCAIKRHQKKPKAIKLVPEITAIVNGFIRQDWSPEQIAGRLKKDRVVDLHHETIYQYILADKRRGGDLYQHLRHQKKTYRKRYGAPHNRHGIPHRRDIDERPASANKRERLGDWEADTIIGKHHQGAIVTLDERVSKLRLAMPTFSKKAAPVTQAIIALFQPIKTYVKTITYDNGKEFVHHQEIDKALDCDAYFAKPYHSWERGQNENANGLLRQYFPKAMSLLEITKQQVFDAVDKLNNRPRKCLEYKTPYEVFEEMTGITRNNLLGYALIT
jgi:IS30 family transposase